MIKRLLNFKENKHGYLSIAEWKPMLPSSRQITLIDNRSIGSQIDIFDWIFDTVTKNSRGLIYRKKNFIDDLTMIVERVFLRCLEMYWEYIRQLNKNERFVFSFCPMSATKCVIPENFFVLVCVDGQTQRTDYFRLRITGILIIGSRDYSKSLTMCFYGIFKHSCTYMPVKRLLK